MNVFVAGASGTIGRPLVAELVRRGHAVTGMTRSEAGRRPSPPRGRPSLR
jgi:nucleoside-diphosphate-sugar epimerase